MNFLTIAKQEIKYVFQTAFGFAVFTIIFALIGSYFFSALTGYLDLAYPKDNSVRIAGVSAYVHLTTIYLDNVKNILLMMVPIMTMRNFAEEKKQSTYDLLVSYPVKPWEIFIGKFLGQWVLLQGLLTCAFLFLSIVYWRGTLYLPQVFAVYLGYSLFFTVYVAFGVLMSLQTENQIVAAILTYTLVAFAILLQYMAFVLPDPWNRVFANFLLVAHLDTFQKGIIFLGDVLSYLVLVILFLYLGIQKLGRHHYR